jgi:uncharacterized protein (DUF1697 family)
MPRHVALLRAVNVGGRTVKMADVVRLLEAAGLSDVSTVIASGNVRFTSRSTARTALAKRVEEALAAGLGIEVDAFVRTPAELAAVVAESPFGAQVPAGGALQVLFFAAPLDGQATATVASFATEADAFEVRGDVVYWRCRTKVSESEFDSKKMERRLARRLTARSITTVVKLAE